MYEAGPGPDEQHWFGGKALAGIDLAAIQLRGRRARRRSRSAGAALSLPAAQRINAVTTRLDLVRAELAAPVFQHSPQARELDERIEEFGQEAIAAELHGLSGGTG